jgi:hypothetical protein
LFRNGLFSLCALLALAACTQKEKTLAKVGRFVIKERDAAYRNEVVKVFYPQANDAQAGLDQLVEAYLIASVLENQGVKLDEKAILAEAARIEKNTKDPQGLARIQAIYGEDKDAYLRTFVLPTLAERLIYFDFFQRSPTVHAKSRAMAVAFLREAKESPADIERLAKKRGLTVTKILYETKAGLRPLGKKARPLPDQNADPRVKEALATARAQHFAEIDRWFAKFLAGTRPGEMLPEPFDQEQSHLVLRFDQRSKTGARLSAAAIPKLTFAPWLEREKAKVKVER